MRSSWLHALSTAITPALACRASPNRLVAGVIASGLMVVRTPLHSGFAPPFLEAGPEATGFAGT